MPKKAGIVAAKDLGRMAAGTIKIEQQTKASRTGKQVGYQVIFVFAKITKNSGDGKYEAEEVLINEDFTEWETLTDGRVWTAAEDTSNEIFHMDFDDSMEINDIVLIFRTNNAGLGGRAKWAIVGNAVASTVSGSATQQSNTATKGKIHFRNDPDYLMAEGQL